MISDDQEFGISLSKEMSQYHPDLTPRETVFYVRKEWFRSGREDVDTFREEMRTVDFDAWAAKNAPSLAASRRLRQEMRSGKQAVLVRARSWTLDEWRPWLLWRLWVRFFRRRKEMPVLTGELGTVEDVRYIESGSDGN